MVFQKKVAVFTAMSLCLLQSQYLLADYDFRPKLVGNQVVTGGRDDEAGVDIDSLRVAGYAFGEEPGDPYNLGDPGFNTLGSTTFAGSSQLRLIPRLIDNVGLRYWDGTGTPNFVAAPSAVTIDLAGSPTRYATFGLNGATLTPGSDSSLLVGSFASNGSLHVHLTSSIFTNRQQYAPDGSPLPIDTGAYLLSFELANPGTGVAISDPLYMVFNNGLSEEAVDLAVAAATAAYVPEPASLAGAAGAGLLLLRRRR